MTSITVDYEFEIGDLVYFQTAAHGRGAQPNRFCVQERLAQECCAGVQKQYRLVGRSDWIPEFALTRTKPPYEPQSDESIEDELRFIGEQQKYQDFLWRERSVKSVANLTRHDGEELMAIAPRVPVATTVHQYGLEDVNRALEDLRKGTFSGAAVVVI